MARRNKSAVERYHDRVASRYDLSYDDAYWQWHDTLTWDHLKHYLPSDTNAPVLDLGCGTGKWAAKLIKSGYRVTCVDISHAMLERARIKIENMGSLDRVHLHQADLMDLSELPKSEFALALALGDPIGCAEKPARALKEIRRRLLPDGVLVATFDNRLAAIEFHLQTGDAKALADFLRHGRTHWLTKAREEQFPVQTYTPNQLVSLVERAGFEVLDLIGKTVLPLRHYRAQLMEPTQRRAMARIEKSLCRDSAAMGRASHLQIVARPKSMAPG